MLAKRKRAIQNNPPPVHYLRCSFRCGKLNLNGREWLMIFDSEQGLGTNTILWYAGVIIIVIYAQTILLTVIEYSKSSSIYKD